MQFINASWIGRINLNSSVNIVPVISEWGCYGVTVFNKITQLEHK